MRYTFLFLLACLAVLAVFGQDRETAQLLQAVQQHPQQDTTRVNMLNTLTQSNSLPADEQEKLATEALTLSRKTGYVVGEGEALLNLSSAKQKKGNRQEAILLVHQADSIAKGTGNQAFLVHLLLRYSGVNRNIDNRRAVAFAKEAETIALTTRDKKLIANCQNQISGIYGVSLNDYPKAIEYGLKSIRSAEEANCLPCLSAAWSNLGAFYNSVGDQANALFYYEKALEAVKKLGNKAAEVSLNNNVGERYRLMGKYKEAIPFYNKAMSATKVPLTIEMAESNLADVYTHMDSLQPASTFAFSSLTKAKQIEDIEGMAWINSILARIYLKKGMADSALYYSKEGLEMAKQTGSLEFMRDNAGALANAYAFKKDFEKAYNYHLFYINYRDSMLNSEISNKSAVLQYNYDLAKKETQITVMGQQQKVQQNFLISALIVLILIVGTAFLLLRNNRQKQKANKLLQKQKHEIEAQRDQTNKVLEELQQTQKQLVQSEKMASLGELTAGIAHEIQNPLNFVNNFSEINADLVDEMKTEFKAGSETEAFTIASEIKENNLKIAFHGKRADAIVKNMLQHSRSSKGEKQPTDINVLTDEYLRLSYHGLRAKDKTFNATLETHFDQSFGKLNLIPQDIGRVLLNLFNNAFYAVHEQQKKLGDAYKPTISVSTKKENGNVEITIQDNGMGVSKSLIDKIFQPFFTTKPSGEGTGLGLSLSYDIIKAHGGDLQVESEEEKGTCFTINLPA